MKDNTLFKIEIKIATIHQRNLKSFSPEPLSQCKPNRKQSWLKTVYSNDAFRCETTLNQSLPLQNQRTNFKPNIDIANVLNESLCSFPIGDFRKMEKIHRRHSFFFSETLVGFFFTKHCTGHPWGMGMHVRLNEKRHPLLGGIICIQISSFPELKGLYWLNSA